jgi:hypothetical protein
MTDAFEFTSPPYLGQVFVVVDHDRDDQVRYKLAEAEKAFSSVVKGEFRATNVPSDAPPEIPRFELREGKRHLLVAQSRLQLGMSFDIAVDPDRSYEIARKYAKKFLEAANGFRSLGPQATMGFVLHINQPSARPKSEVASFVAKQLYKGASVGSLESIDIRLGFKSQNGLYRNFSFNSYEVRQFDVPLELRNKNFVEINVEQIPIAEQGLASVLDINNKARAAIQEATSQVSYLESVEQLLQGMDEMFSDQRHKILNMAPSLG